MYFVTKVEAAGHELELITIRNHNNMEVKLLNYGAALVELLVPDRAGNIENVVLTYENLEDYLENPTFFGVTVGRTCRLFQLRRTVIQAGQKLWGESLPWREAGLQLQTLELYYSRNFRGNIGCIPV